MAQSKTTGRTANREVRDAADVTNQAGSTVEPTGIANPGAAPKFEQASGAIIEPEIAGAVDVEHESVDNNPRAGTSAEQNQIEFNDANRRRPDDPDFAGMGLDPTPYGSGPAPGSDAQAPQGDANASGDK
jgi:hypothetical protein